MFISHLSDANVLLTSHELWQILYTGMSTVQKDLYKAILKKEHSDRVSNIYDSENGIQRRRLPNKCPGTQQPRAAARLSRRPARIAQGCRAEPGRRAFAARARTPLLATAARN